MFATTECSCELTFVAKDDTIVLDDDPCDWLACKSCDWHIACCLKVNLDA